MLAITRTTRDLLRPLYRRLVTRLHAPAIEVSEQHSRNVTRALRDLQAALAASEQRSALLAKELQALRAAVGGSAPPAAVVDAVVTRGVRDRRFEVRESVVHLPGWRPALDARTSGAREQPAQRLATAKWQVPTVSELERELPGVPVRALLAHLARDGAVESMDQERYATKAALGEFRTALEHALGELGQATPAELRDRFGLTRKYLIPLLEWADRRGVTRPLA